MRKEYYRQNPCMTAACSQTESFGSLSGIPTTVFYEWFLAAQKPLLWQKQARNGLKAANNRGRRYYLKNFHNLTLLYSSSHLSSQFKLSVHLPAENGKKASRGIKFPSLSRKWPGLNCRGVSHCSGSYRTDAIFGITMVPCKEETVISVPATSACHPSVCTSWIKTLLVGIWASAKLGRDVLTSALANQFLLTVHPLPGRAGICSYDEPEAPLGEVLSPV